MSIYIHAYSAFDSEISDKINQVIKFKYPDLFNGNFIIYDSDVLEGYEREIAIEDNNIPPNFQSDFLVVLNNKEYPFCMSEIANLFKMEFGDDNVILLQNGEDAL